MCVWQFTFYLVIIDCFFYNVPSTSFHHLILLDGDSSLESPICNDFLKQIASSSYSFPKVTIFLPMFTASKYHFVYVFGWCNKTFNQITIFHPTLCLYQNLSHSRIVPFKVTLHLLPSYSLDPSLGSSFTNWCVDSAGRRNLHFSTQNVL